MTQIQVKELFGVSPATLKDWKNNPSHSKHILGKYLVRLDYTTTKEDIKKFSIKPTRYEIQICKPIDDVTLRDASFFLESEDELFNKEIVKYICFERMIKFLENNKDKYRDIIEYTQDEEFVLIDLFEQARKIEAFWIEHGDFDYIAATSHLDKYGNKTNQK